MGNPILLLLSSNLTSRRYLSDPLNGLYRQSRQIKMFLGRLCAREYVHTGALMPSLDRKATIRLNGDSRRSISSIFLIVNLERGCISR
jgi:hypothetical protein